MSDTEHSFQISSRMESMAYDAEDIDVRSKMDDVGHAVQALPAMSRLSFIHIGSVSHKLIDVAVITS